MMRLRLSALSAALLFTPAAFAASSTVPAGNTVELPEYSIDATVPQQDARVVVKKKLPTPSRTSCCTRCRKRIRRRTNNSGVTPKEQGDPEDPVFGGPNGRVVHLPDGRRRPSDDGWAVLGRNDACAGDVMAECSVRLFEQGLEDTIEPFARLDALHGKVIFALPDPEVVNELALTAYLQQKAWDARQREARAEARACRARWSRCCDEFNAKFRALRELPQTSGCFEHRNSGTSHASLIVCGVQVDWGYYRPFVVAHGTYMLLLGTSVLLLVHHYKGLSGGTAPVENAGCGEVDILWDVFACPFRERNAFLVAGLLVAILGLCVATPVVAQDCCWN